MNKNLFCICLSIISLGAQGFYGPRVHNAQLAFYNPLALDPHADFMHQDYRRVHSHYDDVPLACLEDTLNGSKSKDLETKDKDRITCVIKRIKEEYGFIEKYCSGQKPLKPLKDVSLNYILAYFATSK